MYYRHFTFQDACMSESSPVEYLHKYLYVMQIGTSFGVVSTDIDRMVYN